MIKRAHIFAMIAVVALAPLLAPLVLAGPAFAQQSTTRFVSVIEDLPLMEGLTEVGEGVRFESEQGRIGEAVAEGALDRARVEDFYAQALPQLGWVRDAPNQFGREGERLSIGFETLAQGRLRVEFSIKPR